MPDMDANDSATLARIDERTRAQAETLGLHVKEDSEKFDRVFHFVAERFDKIDVRFDKMDTRLGTLWDTKNSQEGAFGIGKWIAGIAGGLVVAIVDFLAHTHGGSQP